jgi:hypothetical protein
VRSLQIAAASPRVSVRPPLARCARDDEDDVLASMTFAAAHGRQIRSTHLVERLNKETRRRTEGVGVFPNDAALLRFVTMLLVDQNDEWLVGRRYLSIESMKQLDAGSAEQPSPQLAAGRHTRGPLVPIGTVPATDCISVGSATEWRAIFCPPPHNPLTRWAAPSWTFLSIHVQRYLVFLPVTYIPNLTGYTCSPWVGGPVPRVDNRFGYGRWCSEPQQPRG